MQIKNRWIGCLLMCWLMLALGGGRVWAQNTYVSDTFLGTVGTDLNTHTGANALVWSYSSAFGSDHAYLDGNGFLYGYSGTTFMQGLAIASAALPVAGAPHAVSAPFKFISNVSSTESYLCMDAPNTTTASDAYCIGYMAGTGWVWGRVNGVVGSQAVTLTPGTSYTLSIARTGNTITFSVSGTVVGTITGEATPLAPTGYVGVFFQHQQNTTGGTHIGAITATYTGAEFAGIATAIVASPTSVTLSATPPTGASGTQTYQWYQSVSAGVQGTIIAGATSLTPATVSGLTAGTPYFFTLVMTDGVMMYTSNQVSATPTSLIYLDNTSIWCSLGAIRFTAHIGYLIENGTRIKVPFNGTSLAFAVSVADYGSLAPIKYPKFIMRTDAGVWNAVSVTGTGNLVLVSGLANAAHVSEIIYASDDESNTWDATQVGAAGINRLQVTSVILDSGQTLGTLPASGFGSVLPNTALFIGDSITHGFFSSSMIASYFSLADTRYSWAGICAKAINAEPTIIGHSGNGLQHTYTPGTGPVYTSTANAFVNYDSANTRVFSSSYTYCIINLGTNDTVGGGSLAAYVTSFTATVRATLGNSTKIIWTAPFNTNLPATSPNYKSDIATGVANYKAAHPTDLFVYNVNATYVMTTYTDGVHPDTISHVNLGTEVGVGIVRATGVTAAIRPIKGGPVHK